MQRNRSRRRSTRRFPFHAQRTGRLSLITLILALAASAATAQSFSVYTTDGAERTFDLDPHELLDVIVEFESPPLARVYPGQKGAVLGKGGAAAAAIEREHQRFRQDIVALTGSTGLEKSGAIAIRHAYRVTYNGLAVTLPRAAIRRLDELPYVRGVHVNRVVRAHVADAREIVGANALSQRLGLTGEGIVVGILDTGIDYMHPDLGGGIGPGFKVVGGTNTIDDSGSVLDTDGHGTHVAGIVAADGSVQGIAPKARLRAYKVLGDNGGSVESVIAGIEQAVIDGVDIINMSLGSAGSADDPDAIATDNAMLAGVLCVVSAGNAGDLNGTIGSPGNARTALTVGATDRDDHMTIFSSRGPSSGAYQIKPDVVAPGYNVVSLGLGGTQKTLSGTSMASPVVAGAAALLLELHSDWTPQMLKSALMNSAETIHDPKLSNDALPWAQGAGRINVDAAADAAFLVEPGSISFGLADVAPATWESEQTLTLHNTSDQSQTFDLSNQTSLASGATVSIEPSSLTVGAGQTASVSVRLEIENATVPMVGLPPGYTGTIEVRGASQTVDLPYAFVKSNFLRVAFDEIDEVWIGVHDRERKLEDYAFFCNPEIEYVIPLGSEVVDFMFVFIDSFDVVVHPEVDLKTAQQVLISRTQADLTLTMKPVDIAGNPVELLSKQPLSEDDTFEYEGIREGKVLFEYIGQDFGMGLQSTLAYDRFRFTQWPTDYSLRGIAYAYKSEERELYEYPFKVTSLTASEDYTFDASRMKAVRYDLSFAEGLPSVQFVPRAHTAWSERTAVLGYVSCLPDSYQLMTAPYSLTNYLYPRPPYFDTERLGALSHFYETKLEFYDPAGTACTPEERTFDRVYQTGARLIRDESVLYVQSPFETVIYQDRPLLFTTEAASLDIDLGAGAPWWAGEFQNEGTTVRLSAIGKGFMQAPIASYREADLSYVLSSGGDVIQASTMPNTGDLEVATQAGPQRLAISYDAYRVGAREGEARAVVTFEAGDEAQDPPYVERFHVLSDGVPRDVLEPGATNEVQVAVYFPRGDGPDRNTIDGQQAVALEYRAPGASSWIELPTTNQQFYWTGVSLDHLYTAELPDLVHGYYALRLRAEHPHGSTYTLIQNPAFLYGEVSGSWTAPMVSASGRDSTGTDGVSYLSWDDVDGASAYYLQVARDEAFVDVVLEAGGITSSSYGASALQEAGTLYWRVRGENPAYVGAWSEARSFVSSGVSVAVEEAGVPDRYALHASYPNPFNPFTTLRFQTPEQSQIRLDVYDVLGRHVALILDELVGAGEHEVRWDAGAAGLASGMYLFRIEARSPAGEARFADVRTTILMK